MRLPAEILQGRFVRLEPLDAPLRETVQAALDTDPDAWAIMASNGGGEGFADWWDTALAADEQGEPAFAVRRLSDGAVVGTSGYLSCTRSTDASRSAPPSTAPTPAPDRSTPTANACCSATPSRRGRFGWS